MARGLYGSFEQSDGSASRARESSHTRNDRTIVAVAVIAACLVGAVASVGFVGAPRPVVLLPARAGQNRLSATYNAPSKGPKLGTSALATKYAEQCPCAVPHQTHLTQQVRLPWPTLIATHRSVYANVRSAADECVACVIRNWRNALAQPRWRRQSLPRLTMR